MMTIQNKKSGRRVLTVSACVVGACALLAGCIGREPLLNDYQFTDRQIPDETVSIGDRFNAEPVSIFPVKADYYQLRVQETGDPLPDVMVGPIVADGVPISALIDIITAENEIALAMGTGLEDRLVRLRDPKMRPLSEMMEIITENAGVFYSYRKGVFHLSSTRDYDVLIPPVADNLNTVADTMSSFGAQNVRVDERAAIISFSADRATVDRINPYLRKSRDASDMIVYDAWFLEVSLDDGNEWGIDWNQFDIPSPGLGIISPISITSAGGAGAGAPAAFPDASFFNLGLMAEPGNFIIDMVAGFLETQGAVRSLSKPTLAMISGGSSEFTVGETFEYVSELESDISADGQRTTSSVTTSTLETGIDVGVAGSYADGTIYTEISLELDNLIRFQQFDAGDTQLSLPQTAQRTLETSLQSRPGDLLLIAGLMEQRIDQDRDFIPFTDVPISSSDLTERSELVIMIRPRLIHFRPESEEMRKEIADFKRKNALQASQYPKISVGENSVKGRIRKGAGAASEQTPDMKALLE